MRVPFQMLIGVNRRHSLQGYTEAAGCRSSVKRIEASVAAAVATASRRRRGIRRGGGRGAVGKRDRESGRGGRRGKVELGSGRFDVDTLRDSFTPIN